MPKKNDLGSKLDDLKSKADKLKNLDFLNSTPQKNSTASKSKSTKSTTAKSTTAKSTAPKSTLAKSTKPSGSGGGGKKSSKRARMWRIRIVACLIVCLILAGSLLFTRKIDTFLRLRGIIEDPYKTSTTEATGEGIVPLSEKLNIHFVDVGQGDACIIELPDGQKMIIDGGKDKEKAKLLTYIDEHIATEDGMPITGFDIAILTHSDEDHCGGLDDVLLQYPADIFYRPNQLATYNNYNDPGLSLLFGAVSDNAKDTRAYMRAIDAGHKGAKTIFVTNALDNSQNLIKPASVSPSDPEYYTINFFTPTKSNYKDVNDYSPIIILEYQGKRIVLSGDAEAEAEREFVELAQKGEGKYNIFTTTYTVDMIKLGHHGSRTSSSTEYLEKLTTEDNIPNVLLIISCGSGNSYGHPHSDLLKKLLKLGFKEENILRTDINGTIAMSIRFDEESGTFELFHGAEKVERTVKKPVTWLHIAPSLIIATITLLIIIPLKSNP